MASRMFTIFTGIFMLLTFTLGIKFDLPAGSENAAHRKCISNIVNGGPLVVVTLHVGPGPNQNVHLEIFDDSPSENQYGRKTDINNEVRFSFIAQADASIHVCLTNYLMNGIKQTYTDSGALYKRTIELDVDIGADAVDYNNIAKKEKLEPLEAEMRRLEQVSQEIVGEMEYLRRREARLRDTNESTNERVKWFSILTMFSLVGLGGWQIMYLRTYFRKKHLID